MRRYQVKGICSYVLGLAGLLLVTGLYGQKSDNALLATLEAFQLKGKGLQASYGEKKQGHTAFKYSYAKVVILTYRGNPDTLKHLYQALKAGENFENICGKFKLRPYRDYYPGCFFLPPVFLTKYFQKLVFHAIPILNRNNNFSFTNSSGVYKTIEELKKGTRLVDTLDNELTCAEFESGYSLHELPGFLNEGVNYYEKITGNADPLFYRINKIEITSYPGLDSLLRAWDNIPVQLSKRTVQEGKHPAGVDTIALAKEKNEELQEEYNAKRCNTLNQLVLEKKGEREKIAELSDDLYENDVYISYKVYRMFNCLGIKQVKNPDKYYTPLYRSRATYGKYNGAICLQALRQSNYANFAKSIPFYNSFENSSALDRALNTASKEFYSQHTSLFLLGYLGSSLLTNKSDCVFALNTLERVDNEALHQKIVGSIEEWLKSKPGDGLLVYLLGQYWHDYIETCTGCDAEAMEKRLEDALKDYPGALKFISEY